MCSVWPCALCFSAAEDAVGMGRLRLAGAARGPSLPPRSADGCSCHGVTRRSLPAMSSYMPDPELRRARFDALFRDHHPVVRAYARRRVPPEVVDDVVSETFLVVWRRLDDVPEAPLPWLLAVARNVVGTASYRDATPSSPGCSGCAPQYASSAPDAAFQVASPAGVIRNQ
jgi:hypothetical protein